MKTILTSMKTHLTPLYNGSRTCAMTEPVAGRKPVLALLMRLLWAAALVLPAFSAHASATLTSLHSFQVFTNGENPSAGLVQGSDGDFYGTTSGGGTNGGYGTVFKISTNGALTSLYSFTGGIDGRTPQAGLVQGSDGNLYGTTFYGGTNGLGTVFKISTNGALTSLYSFTGGNDGGYPQAGLVQGSDGYFYGTTEYNGFASNTMHSHFLGSGAVFKISMNGALTSLYSFTGGNDGGNPQAGLVQGSDGYFYGTTSSGGTNGWGNVFKISTNGTLTSLYSFTGGNDGGYPLARLVQGRDGSFYGTTVYGGTYPFSLGDGTVFQISTTGALTTLYSFTGGDDGGYPSAGLVQGNDGYFYGTTEWGGTNSLGTVFKISANGALTSLYSFTGGNDGRTPQAGLVQGSGGSLYGTTQYGGTTNYNAETETYGFGTVFKISTNGTLTSLYSFPGGDDGANPQAGLVQGSDGNFYGTTVSGGTNGNGTVFKVSPNGALTSLYSFTGGSDGANPSAGLVQGSDGNFYGTTQYGGTNGNGTVFKISTNGVLTSLYSFTGGNDGANPNGLVQGSDGNFYGTTEYGGTSGSGVAGAGTVFEISPNGALTSLYSFADGNDGRFPQAGLVQGSDGYLYGTTEYGGTNSLGTVFKISTNGALTTLYSFGSVQDTNGYLLDGAEPTAGLVQGSDGNFYGTTSRGGGNNYGTVFQISPNGVLTSLHSFTGGNDGEYPSAGLLQGSDGYFYGTTEYNYGTLFGGLPGSTLSGAGTVFRISTNGALTTLYSFTGGNDGGNAKAGLVQGSDGSFYGTTSGGGVGGGGTVFRLTIVPEPQLTLIPSGPYVILTWPTDYAGFSYARYTLQSTTDLGSSAVWTTNSSPPVVIGGENVVINTTTSGKQQFYRLSQ